MRIYLASRYSRREELKAYALQAEAAGISVTSRWLKETNNPNSSLGDESDDILAQKAENDAVDVCTANVLVFFAEDHNNQPPRGARHVEFGIAIGYTMADCGWDKQIIVVGKEENLFHFLPRSIIQIEFFDTWESALAYLKAIK